MRRWPPKPKIYKPRRRYFVGCMNSNGEFEIYDGPLTQSNVASVVRYWRKWYRQEPVVVDEVIQPICLAVQKTSKHRGSTFERL